MLSKEETEKKYWEGYIQKQNEAMEICKQCKYIKKTRELETREQKLIEKLEEDIEIARKEYQITLNDRQDGIRAEAQEILKILKGENDEKE